MRSKLFFSSLLFLVLFTGCDQGMHLENKATVDAIEAAQPAALSLQQILASSDNVVELPAGSVDALADAIAEAGEGGIVLLKAGAHHESDGVEIGHRVSIVGEHGAQLISTTATLAATGRSDAALYVHNAAGVLIQGIEMLPEGGLGGTAIFAEDAPNTVVHQNTITDYEYGVVVHQGDRSAITSNTIVGHPGWLTGDLPDVGGIINVNGDFVDISGNIVSNSVLGIFASDRKGKLADNEVHGNFIGIILCNVPPVVPLPVSGDIVGSETNATQWTVRENHAHDNFDIGILVIDGANDNLLVNNQGGNNGRYDIELAGNSERFGFFTPTSRESVVDAGKYKGLVLKDCGVDDIVNGEFSLVDTSADPCG